MRNRLTQLPTWFKFVLLALGIAVAIPLILRVRHERMNYELGLAAEEGREADVRGLIAAGADVNAIGGETHHKPTSAHLLFTTVPNKIWEERRQEQTTPLMLSVMSRQPNVVAALLEKGARVDTHDEYGYTALSLAISLKQPVIARLLLEHGANPGVTSDIGMAPLPWAVMMQQTNLVQLLLEKGANANTPNSDGTPPLYIAVLDDNADMVRLLLHHHADPNAHCKTWSVLRLALAQHNAPIIALLKQAGAR